jgi:DnaJ-related protein SCJ1
VKAIGRHLCEHCRGSGADSESDVHQCHECGGKGHTIIMQPIGPGFMQQIQQQCSRCGGKGKIVTKQCHVCKGRKLSNGQRILDIAVEQGMTDDSRIEFEHAADESPDIAAGHVVFKILTAPHRNFTRRGKDLHFTQKLTLLEALTGFDKTIRQLDGRLVSIRSDDVTPHGQVMRVKGEGMPVHTVPSQRGDLYVKFAVELPKTLTNEQKEGFAEILKNVK